MASLDMFPDSFIDYLIEHQHDKEEQMPYIKQDRREELGTMFDEPSYHGVSNPGELNYILTLHIKQYLKDKGKSYQTINDIIGAIEGAKLEFYRRVAAPYEDTKIKENGDVY